MILETFQSTIVFLQNSLQTHKSFLLIEVVKSLKAKLNERLDMTVLGPAEHYLGTKSTSICFYKIAKGKERFRVRIICP